jgi:Cu(I)/Ag(I) efflux system protein CusF
MTSRVLVAIATTFLANTAAPALAHRGHDHQAEVPQTAAGQGVVRAVNTQAGTVTLAHEPIPALGWPAMTMAFRVRSADLLNGVSVGARVHFVLANNDGRPILTELQVLPN